MTHDKRGVKLKTDRFCYHVPDGVECFEQRDVAHEILVHAQVSRGFREDHSDQDNVEKDGDESTGYLEHAQMAVEWRVEAHLI